MTRPNTGERSPNSIVPELCCVLVAAWALAACARPAVVEPFSGVAKTRKPPEAVMTVNEKNSATLSASETSGAQQVSGAEITVIVTDPDGSVVPGVTVTAINAQTRKNRWFITGDDGIGYLRGLEAGNWVLAYQREGSAIRGREIEVIDGGSTSATVSLTTSVEL